MTDWNELSEQLQGALGLANQPLAITFHDSASGVVGFDDPMPGPAE